MSNSYEKARQIRDAQDAYCVKARNGQWTGLGEFPEDLQWEALVDVLRGRVKVSRAVCLAVLVTYAYAGPYALLRNSRPGRSRQGKTQPCCNPLQANRRLDRSRMSSSFRSPRSTTLTKPIWSRTPSSLHMARVFLSCAVRFLM